MASKPGRFDAGTQMGTGTAAWNGATGVGGIYYKTAVGLVMRKTDNSEVTLGAAGGGGTLATVYSGGASTADSTISLDSTRGKILIKDNATPIGTLFEIQSSGGTSFYLFNASNMNFGVNRGITTSAGIGAFDFSSATGVFKTSTGSHTFGSATWAVPANLVVTGAASSTNTVGMLHTSNVADGATSVAQRFDNTTAATTDGNLAFQFRNGGSDWVTFGRTSSARKFTFFGDADSSGSGPVLIKSTSSSAGLTLDATTAGGRIYQQYSTSAGLYNIADITAGANRWQMDSNGHWSPSADNTYDFGIASTNRVRTLNCVRTDLLRITSPTQNVAFSATPAFNATNGGVIHFGAVTANVTGPTMTSGVAGERCTIVFLKDGTAGAFTIAGWGSNVRVNGTATFAAGANSIICMSFVWDDRLGTPAWVLQSQQAVV